MKVQELIETLIKIQTKYGNVDVFLAPRIYMSREIHKLTLTTKHIYISNKKTKPELQFKLELM